jgi:DNA processing protein
MELEALTEWLTLQAIEGVGDRTFLKLANIWGTPAAVLSASVDDLVKRGCSRDLADTIRRGPDLTLRRQIERQVKTVDRLKIRVVTIYEGAYPKRLKTIPDPPPLLYFSGRLTDADEAAVAIVGGRRATAAGRAVTEEIARDLAASGITVVSGLARGIDAAAHRGALAGGGRTLAVLGCGIDRTYPPEHDGLRRLIEMHGAVIAELPVGSPPQSHHFPRRNRIISGLALGVLVSEAATSSGSLITAKLALEQGRDVFAMPGSVKEEACRGSNGLIKEGAKLIDCAADILDELRPQMEPALRARIAADATGETRADFGKDETLVYDTLSYDPRPVDAVIEQTGMTAAQVAATLLTLELRGRVRQLPGQQYMRC